MIYLLANADQLPDTFPGTCGAFCPGAKNIQNDELYPVDRPQTVCSRLVLLVYALKREDLFTELPILGTAPLISLF
jgi:hypothetical protein